MTRPRAFAVSIALLAAACGGDTPTAPSTTLTGTLQAFSAKGDDFTYFLDVTLTAAGGAGATVTSIGATVTTPTAPLVSQSDALAQAVAPGATVSEPRIAVRGQGGLAYATSISVTVSYVDDRGRKGSLLLTTSPPTCQTFLFAATCAQTRLQVGESSTCSGFVEFGCQPMFEPLTAAQIQWRSDAPNIATMSTDFHLVGVANGSATLTGTFNSVSSAIHVCVGPQCAPLGR